MARLVDLREHNPVSGRVQRLPRVVWTPRADPRHGPQYTLTRPVYDAVMHAGPGGRLTLAEVTFLHQHPDRCHREGWCQLQVVTVEDGTVGVVSTEGWYPQPLDSLVGLVVAEYRAAVRVLRLLRRPDPDPLVVEMVSAAGVCCLTFAPTGSEEAA